MESKSILFSIIIIFNMVTSNHSLRITKNKSSNGNNNNC